MRLVLAVLLLAACSSKASSGPAWPKMTDKEVDGGESLAPRAKAAAVATAKSDADDKPAASVDKPAAATTPKTDAETPKPATTPGSTQAPEELIMTTEEIIIEIDD